MTRLALSGDQITVGDLSTVLPGWEDADASLVLGRSPLPGIQRRVSRIQLLRWANQAGLELGEATLPGALIIERLMRRLGSGEVVEATVRSLQERYQLTRENISVELHEFTPPLVPDTALALELSSQLARFNEPTSLFLSWTDPRGRTGNIRFQATVRVTGLGAVAHKDLPARTLVQPGDFELVEGFLPGDPGEYLITNQLLTGRELRISLTKGQYVKRSQLVVPHAVERGDVIEIQLASRSIRLRVAGKAEEPGRVGDEIAVRNIESGRRILTRVVGPKRVEVLWNTAR